MRRIDREASEKTSAGGTDEALFTLLIVDDEPNVLAALGRILHAQPKKPSISWRTIASA